MGDSSVASSVGSMRALRPQIDPACDARALWQLPDWDAYSAASSPLSSSSASSLVSVQRSPVALATRSPSAAKRQSALRQLHQRYAAQRHAAQAPPPAECSDDAAAQWLALLSRKVALLAAACDREASADEQQVEAELAAWRQGGGEDALATHVPPRVKEKLCALERALAALSVAVERATRRTTERCESSVAQLQGFHHDKLQRVADESVEEIKQVRARHKSQRAQLEAELRGATRAADEWKQRAAEVEHRSALEREKIEFQAATFRDKFERLSVRFEEDIVQITQQLEAARCERSEAQSSRDALAEQLARLQHEAHERQSQEQELAHETQRWRATVESMRRDHDVAVQELTHAKRVLADQLEKAERQHAREVESLVNRLGMRTEDDYRATVASEQLVDLQQRHEQQLAAMRATYEQRVAEQGRAVEEALEELRASRVRAAAVDTDTQTEEPRRCLDAAADVQTDAERRVQALSRKCRALENLLDRKFEEQSERGAASPLCMSCVSSSSRGSQRSDGTAASTGFALHQWTGDRASNHHSDVGAVDRGMKWPSSFPRAASPADANDTTLFTDVNTTMRNETWDLDSVTSTDTFERLSPYTPRSRPQSAGGGGGSSSNAGSGVPSNDDILALVRKLESYTASAASSLPEPEAEHQTMFRTPESRAMARRTQPPPVHRTRKEAAALRPSRQPNTPLTAKPLRSSLASGSSISSASPSSVGHQRQRPAASKPSSALSNRPAPRAAARFS
ncbi:hypothetical protein PybrP1_005223 [[Pythium] brassicae (nom. inval.)]|nr:hypothetical protein PybrP1_005223 [[Pythium] brassicae (nom. inval.)]